MATWLSGITRQDFGTDGGSWTRQPAIIVLHSTESGDHGWPGYSDGQSCPHFTHDPLTGDTRQHVPLDRAARALKNPSGGVETNRGGAVQIEIIGTCDPDHRGDKGWTYLPDFDGWSPLSALLAQIADATGIPLASSVDFEPYPEPGYGSGHPRLSGSSWQSYKGVLGHQHVPENDHGDPGNIDIGAILEDDVSAKEVWQTDGLIPAPDRTDTASNPYWAPSSYVHNIGEWVLACRDMLQDLTERVAELQGAPAPPPLPPIPDDPNAVAPGQ